MEKNKGNKRGLWMGLALLVIAAVALAALYFATRPATAEGEKALVIAVTHGSGEEKDFAIHTDADYLGQALLASPEIGVVGEEGQYGLYITEVDGEQASDADHTYWSLSRDGVMLEVGADSQPVADGEHYELVLSKW